MKQHDSSQYSMNFRVMHSNFASTDSPEKRGSRHTSADAENALPWPNCTLCQMSTLWKLGLLLASCNSSLVKQASEVHGIVRGGIVRRNAGDSDLDSSIRNKLKHHWHLGLYILTSTL